MYIVISTWPEFLSQFFRLKLRHERIFRSIDRRLSAFLGLTLKKPVYNIIKESQNLSI